MTSALDKRDAAASRSPPTGTPWNERWPSSAPNCLWPPRPVLAGRKQASYAAPRRKTCFARDGQKLQMELGCERQRAECWL